MVKQTGPSDPVGAKAHLAAAMPYIEHELQRMQAQLIANAFMALGKGIMTDQKAKELWIEMAVIAGLSRKLSTSIGLDAARAEKLLNQPAV